MNATALLCSVLVGCSNRSADVTPTGDVPRTTSVETSASRQPCASDAVAVAVRFATAVKAHDINGYSACESATTPPAPHLIATLAAFDTLVIEHAAATGNSVDIPSPPIPNGNLPPHQCGVTVVGTDEAGGWYVTDVTFYRSS